MKNTYNIFVAKPEGKRPLEDLGIDGKIILEWILGKDGGDVYTVFIRLRTGISGGLCEDGNEPSGYINGGYFGSVTLNF